MPHFKLFRLLFTCIPEKLEERKHFIMSFAFSALVPPSRSPPWATEQQVNMESGAFSSLVQRLQRATTFHSDCFFRERHYMQVLPTWFFTAGCTSTLQLLLPARKTKVPGTQLAIFNNKICLGLHSICPGHHDSPSLRGHAEAEEFELGKRKCLFIPKTVYSSLAIWF